MTKIYSTVLKVVYGVYLAAGLVLIFTGIGFPIWAYISGILGLFVLLVIPSLAIDALEEEIGEFKALINKNSSTGNNLENVTGKIENVMSDLQFKVNVLYGDIEKKKAEERKACPEDEEYIERKQNNRIFAIKLSDPDKLCCPKCHALVSEFDTQCNACGNSLMETK